MRHKVLIAIAVVAAMIFAELPAWADDGSSNGTTVSATVGSGTRQLKVLDAAGNSLTDLSLTPGEARMFEVEVADTDWNEMNKGFTVSVVMNNLYAWDGAENSAGDYDYTKSIPSSQVSIDYPANRAVSGIVSAITDVPLVNVTGTLPGCTGGVLGLGDLLDSLGLTLSDLLGGVTDLLNLCDLLGSDGLIIDGLQVASSLSGELVDPLIDEINLPFSLTGAEAGKFTYADYDNGIGAAASAKPLDAPPPTARTVLSATGLTDLTSLTSELDFPEKLPTNLVSTTGAGALVSLESLLSALSGAGGMLSGLVGAISNLTASAKVKILNDLVGTVSSTVATLSGETGSYRAFPRLTVDSSGAPAGTYRGTMTITLVQP